MHAFLEPPPEKSAGSAMDRNMEGERLETGCGRVRPVGATMLARNLGARVAVGARPIANRVGGV